MKPLASLRHLSLIGLFFITMPFATARDKANTAPKNIIIFIGDGMGFNHLEASSYFKFGEKNKFIFQSNSWIQTAQSTYPAVTRKRDNKLDFATGYNPHAAWNDPLSLKSDATDSGAGGTTLSTGFKTYRGSIGMGILGDTLLHISDYAKSLGKAAGVVSTVMFSHATPASFATHNEFRNNYDQIGQSMIIRGRLDVIAGTGNPDYDNDGKPTTSDFKYVGGNELWTQLKSHPAPSAVSIAGKITPLRDVNGDGKPDAWTLVTDSTRFAAMARGESLPKRLLGVPQVHSTLQQARGGDQKAAPFQTPRVSGIPNLEQMTLAALNVLNQNRKGFFLMVEGGAIDWAAHDNQSGRAIEETIDFTNSIEATVKWVEKNSNWNETLIIITADHETGLLWGSMTDNKVLTPIQNLGKGNLPGMQWHHTDHTNSLVPLYLRGAGSRLIFNFLDEFDPIRGAFAQNSEVARLMFMLWGKK